MGSMRYIIETFFNDIALVLQTLEAFSSLLEQDKIDRVLKHQSIQLYPVQKEALD